MTNFVANNVSSGNIIYANDHNELGSRIAAVINGGLDDNNISSLSGSKVTASTLPSTALDANTAGGWVIPTATFTYSANNGNKEFVLTPSADPTGYLSAGMKLRLTRGTVPPTQTMAFASASSQYATKASPSGITFNGAFTCEAWVYLNSYTGQQQTIISRTDGSTAGWSLHINSSGQIRLFYGAASAFTDFNSYQSIPLNRWVHIAAVVTSVASKTGAIYINGTSVPTFQTVTGATTLSQTGNLSVGAQAVGASNTFLNGYVSEARVWSTNQSQANVQSNMAISLSGSETNLVALFQGNGNFNDKTSNANNLTATNSAIATQAANPYNSIEYGIITKVASGAVTVFTGTDCTIPNMTLDSPAYSPERSPYGFPASKGKWKTDTLFIASVNTALTASTWTNLAGRQTTVNTGEWILSYQSNPALTDTSSTTVLKNTLSTANNSASDSRFTASITISPSTEVEGPMSKALDIPTVASQTTYYLNIWANGTGTLTGYDCPDNTDTMIEAECAYV